MKTFTISAIFAMGIVALSSAAFAGTTSDNYRGFNNSSVADTVVPNDTVVPADTLKPAKEQPADTTTKQEVPAQFNLADTVVPADTLTPSKKDEPVQKEEPTKKDEPNKQEDTTNKLL